MRQNVAPPVAGSDPSTPEARHPGSAPDNWLDGARLEDAGHLASKGQEPAAMLSDAIGLITRRLEDIERKISEPQQPSAMASEQSGVPTAHPGDHNATQGTQIEAALRGVEDRIAQVSDRIAQGSQRGGGRARIDGTFELNSAIEEIRSRQSELEDGPAKRGAAGRPHTELLRSLKDDFSRLSGQLDTGRQASSSGDASTASLRGEIGGLRQSVGELATREEVGALERAVRELSAKVAEAPPSESDLAGFAVPLANLQAEMQTLSQLVAADAKGRAALDLEALSRKLDAIAQTGIKSPTVEMLSRELGEVRALLKEIADPHRVRNLAEQVAGLNHQLAQVRRQFGNSDLSEMTGAINEIRTALAARDSTGSPYGDTVARELERLSARVETVLAAGAPISTDQQSWLANELERLSARVEEAVQAADHPAGLEQHNRAVARELDRLSGRIEGALAAAKTPVGADALMERLDRLDETLGRSRRDGELKPIEDMLSALAEKLDLAERPGGDLDGLEQQVALLSERLERSSPDPALASLERSMGDLLAQMESLRSGTAEAAEKAVKAAVVSTLEAMPLGGPEIDALKEELADLKASQDEAGKWTQDTFSAVHVTLDKVVSRLATLDIDVSTERLAVSGERLAAAASTPELPEPATPPAAEPSDATPPGAAKQLEDSLKLLEAELVPHSNDPADLDLALEVTKPKEILLEPGEARPRRDVLHAANQPGAADPGDIKASFIAAARRAAQAASDEAAAGKEKGGARRSKATQYSDLGRDGGHSAKRAKQRLDDRRRPILLGLAAVVLALGALQVGGTYYGQTSKLVPVAAPPRIEAKLAPQAAPSSPAREAAAASNLANDSFDPRTTAGLPSGPVGQADEPASSPVEASSGARQDGDAKSMARLDLPKPGGRLDGPDAAPAQTTPGAPAPNAAAAPPLERISNMASIGQIPANAGPPGLRQAALAGDPVAVYELASRAAEGRGAPRDLALAARLYEKAAGHGLVPAQYRTGNLYEKGLGVSRDLVIAKSWYQRAADKGNARAMHNLAVLIAEGVGGKPDYGSAIGWFRRAAQYGVRDSQFNLAVLLARGLGTQQDLSGSYMWFAVVASQGDEDAGKKRDEVAARLSPSELAAAKLTAERWRPDTPDKAVNEVALPAQGWAESPPPAKRPGSNNGKV